jgi:Polyketide cyclase / dehydrase and lipid transport
VPRLPLALRRQIAVTGPQPPDEVWDRYVRPARWAQWSPQITGVDYGPERLVPGTKGLVRGPLGLPVPFEVLAVDESDPARRLWRWRAGALGVQVELEHVVEPDRSEPGGSRTVLVLSGPAPVVVPYLPLARLALHRLVSLATPGTP